MAATRPIAVASSASAMPGATTARFDVWAWLMPTKLSMMPHTVPNSPTKGATEPTVASTPVPRAMPRAARASMRPSDSAARSLTPSAGSPSERSTSSCAAATSAATGPDASTPSSASASARRASPRRARAVPAASAAPLPSSTDQVTSEASARPTITDFTTMSAWRNIDQGDRSCGRAPPLSSAAPGRIEPSSAARATPKRDAILVLTVIRRPRRDVITY